MLIFLTFFQSKNHSIPIATNGVINKININFVYNPSVAIGVINTNATYKKYIRIILTFSECDNFEQ